MSTTLKLPAKLDLPAVGKLVSELKEAESDVRVDGSDVAHLGALCLQALIAAARKANATGGSFEIIGASDKLVAQMEIMGTSPQKLMEGI